MFDEMLGQFDAEWQLTRGDLSGMDETKVFELAKQAYPNNLERAKNYASSFMAARLEAAMKQPATT